MVNLCGIASVFTSTVTTAAIATSTVPAFKLQIVGGVVAGRYVALDPYIDGDGIIVDKLTTTADLSSAAVWTLDAQSSTLVNLDTGLPLYSSIGAGNYAPARVLNSAGIATEGNDSATATCDVASSDDSLLLVCSPQDSPDNNVWNIYEEFSEEDFFLSDSANANTGGYIFMSIGLIGID